VLSLGFKRISWYGVSMAKTDFFPSGRIGAASLANRSIFPKFNVDVPLPKGTAEPKRLSPKVTVVERTVRSTAARKPTKKAAPVAVKK